MVFKKIIFQNSLMANETPSRPPPLMANAIKNFHFDFPHTSLTTNLSIHNVQELVLTMNLLQIYHHRRFVEIIKLSTFVQLVLLGMVGQYKTKKSLERRRGTLAQ